MPTKQRLIYSSAQKTKKIEKSEENAKQFTDEGGRSAAATTSREHLPPVAASPGGDGEPANGGREPG